MINYNYVKLFVKTLDKTGATIVSCRKLNTKSDEKKQ